VLLVGVEEQEQEQEQEPQEAQAVAELLGVLELLQDVLVPGREPGPGREPVAPMVLE